MADLNTGTLLSNVYGPYSEAGQMGAAVGNNDVTSIVVEHLSGPMGHYHAAFVYKGDVLAYMLPLHMMESISVLVPT